jgi:hypothetical protein
VLVAVVTQDRRLPESCGAADLFSVPWMASDDMESCGRQPGDDDPDEGETITVGDFMAALAHEMRRRRQS